MRDLLRHLTGALESGRAVASRPVRIARRDRGDAGLRALRAATGRTSA